MAAKTDYVLNWSDYAMGSKAALKGLGATFIAAPRSLSDERIKQLIKKYLPAGNIVWGIAEGEAYIKGFEGQPQFRTLTQKQLLPWVEKINTQSPTRKIYMLRYKQRDLEHLLRPLKAKQYVFIRGSWQYTLHTSAVFYKLVQLGKLPLYVSPFASEDEARLFASSTETIGLTNEKALKSKADFIKACFEVAKASYDHSFQVGAILAERSKEGYSFRAAQHNRVVPYETFAMHRGFSREDNYAPSNDQNFYDTTHAETALLLGRPLPEHPALFVNVLPCPTCSRNIIAAGVREVYYALDHSDGYATRMFHAAGIICERIVT